MHIYIPTYRRADRQVTWGYIPEYWREHVTFVLDAEDEHRMRLNAEFSTATFWRVPEHVTTIAKKRAFILENTRYSKILMLDDDLFFDARADGRLTRATTTQTHLALLEMDATLDRLAHAAFSASRGNNRLRPGWQNENTRAMYALGFKPAIVRAECELGRIEFREDFDYTLQLLRKGYPNAVYADLAMDQSYNTPGGCRDQRTVAASDAAAEQLAELHPGFVRVVEKDYDKSTKRKEVVVQWKKAYQSSRN